ncbi:MAG: Gfo/Idh/MocA family oxidoreductase [Prolixibacteraceae bacterium]|nr:Gfo/Idh/MocA family oxidoreductase [Prolixibacteraceae bacterium]
MRKAIKWGVIGSGGIARRRTIPEGIMASVHSKLISVFDIDAETNNAVASEFGVKAVSSVDELLNSGIDAVYIASPVNMHLEHTIAAANAGKHVLCEKPFGLSVDQAKEMIDVCQKANVRLGIGLMMRFLAQHQAALHLIDKGKLGNPVYARAQLSCWYPPIENAWRQNPEIGGGGSLIDMGSHCIDLLEMFFGHINSVSCFTNNIVHNYKSEDSAVISLSFENGALATVDSFFCIPDESSKNILELYGSKGSILAKGTIGQGISGEMLAYLQENTGRYDSNQVRNNANGIPVNPKPVNMYLAEIDEFSLAIIESREPANNFAIGLRNQKILAACYQSANLRKVIDID